MLVSLSKSRHFFRSFFRSILSFTLSSLSCVHFSSILSLALASCVRPFRRSLNLKLRPCDLSLHVSCEHWFLALFALRQAFESFAATFVCLTFERFTRQKVAGGKPAVVRTAVVKAANCKSCLKIIISFGEPASYWLLLRVYMVRGFFMVNCMQQSIMWTRAYMIRNLPVNNLHFYTNNLFSTSSLPESLLVRIRTVSYGFVRIRTAKAWSEIHNFFIAFDEPFSVLSDKARSIWQRASLTLGFVFENFVVKFIRKLQWKISHPVRSLAGAEDFQPKDEDFKPTIQMRELGKESSLATFDHLAATLEILLDSPWTLASQWVSVGLTSKRRRFFT